MADRIEIGTPGHFVAARDCWFRLHTHVNGRCVSTVGDYTPPSRAGRAQIGSGRYYETMVFALGASCPHGGTTVLYMRGYQTDAEAQAGHELACGLAASGRIEEDANV